MPIDAIKKLVAPPSLKKPAPDYVAKSKLAQRTGTTPAKAAASAATAIESAFRGKKAREKAAQEEAARKIESIWRGHASRAHAKEAEPPSAEANMKKRLSAASEISQVVERNQQRKVKHFQKAEEQGAARALKDAHHQVDEFFKDGADAALFNAVNASAGAGIHASINNHPFLPNWLAPKMHKATDDALAVVRERLRMTREARGKGYTAEAVQLRFAKKAMLDPANWPPAPELCSRRWASWLRCRVLYAIWPADRDITYAIFVERWMLAVIASLFIPYVNVAAWFLVGLFIVFGTRDEYQLLNYVATYRSFCFLFRGFMKLVFRYFVFYACISHDNCHVVHGEVNLFINRVTIVNYVLCWCCFAKYEYLRNVHGAIKEVYTVTPASDRVVSALIIWDVAIFFILVAVFSLELTFAIGDSVDEDDSVPAVLLRNMMAILGLRGFEGATDGGWFGGDATDDLTIDESAAIDDFNQNGGSLSGGALDNYVVARSRIMLSFMVTTLSLAAAPWLAFWLGGVIVHMMVATGYDQAGHVHLQLTQDEIKTKWDKENGKQGVGTFVKKRVAGSIMVAFGGGAKESPGSEGKPKKKGLMGKMFGGKAKGK